MQAGVEGVIERNAQPLAVIRAAAPARRTIPECIALAEAHEKETCIGMGSLSPPMSTAPRKKAHRSFRHMEFEPTLSRGGDMAMDFLSPATVVKELKDTPARAS